jgi:hypothetical protein
LFLVARDAQCHVVKILRAVLGHPHHHRQAQRAVIAELQKLAAIGRESIAIGRRHVSLEARAHRRLDDLMEVNLACEFTFGAEREQFEAVGLELRLE